MPEHVKTNDAVITILYNSDNADELLHGLNSALRPLDIPNSPAILVADVRTLAPGTCLQYMIECPAQTDIDLLRTDLKALGRKFDADVNIQSLEQYKSTKRLVVFDMDSTLIQQEVIDEIAAFAGVSSQVSVMASSSITLLFLTIFP